MKKLGRDFWLLWQGQLVSQLGNQAFVVAVMFWTMEGTGSASLVGLLMMASSLPSVLLGPVGGTVADWYSRRTILIVSDVLSGLAILALAAAFLLSAPTTVLVPLLFLAAVTTGALSAFFRPAITASIRDLVPVGRIPAANSLMQLSSQVAGIVGQGLGGILYRVLGAPVLFLADGVSYLLSALSEAFIRLPPAARRESTTVRAALAEFRDDTVSGLRYVWSHRGMRTLLFVSSAVNFFATPIFVLLPFYVDRVLGQGAAWYGFLLAALSAGSVTGLVVAGTMKVTGERLAAVLTVAFLGASALIGSLSLVESGHVALGLLALVGILTGMINVHTISIFQTRTPDALRGRVLGLVHTLAGGVVPLGMLLGGLAGDATGKDIPLVYAFCGGAATLVAAMGALNADFRAFLAGTEPFEEA